MIKTTATSGEFKIESDVPVPASGFRSAASYPWHDMKPGDSFLLKWPDELTARQRESIRSSIGGSARHAKVKYITRNIPEGLRVWRTE